MPLCLCSCFISVVVLIFTSAALVVGYILSTFRKSKKFSNKKEISFFHPYCNDGGGGERVLWAAVKSIIDKKDVNVTIYTGDVNFKPSDILLRVKQRFNIDIPANINFVYLNRRKWIEPSPYPYFTILGQSLGSVWLGLEALNAHQSDIYIDTMGYAFTYPLFKYLGYCKVASYTHFPTITKEMIGKVSSREASHNNRSNIARSRVLTFGKLIYYKLFALLYGAVGRCCDVVMVNSSWTKGHIDTLWNVESKLVYPPCDVDDLKSIPRGQTDCSSGEIRIVSVAQFRPEKNHALQLYALSKLRDLVSDDVWKRVVLVIIGAVRNDEDKRRATELEDLAKTLSVEDNVHFKFNISYEELKTEFKNGTIGIHSMWNEHFGIGVVECLAAGLITIAHASGGPKLDIVKDGCGFLAETAEEYAEAIYKVTKMNKDELKSVIDSARLHVEKFSNLEFEKLFLSVISGWLEDKQE